MHAPVLVHLNLQKSLAATMVLLHLHQNKLPVHEASAFTILAFAPSSCNQACSYTSLLASKLSVLHPHPKPSCFEQSCVGPEPPCNADDRLLIGKHPNVLPAELHKCIYNIG